MHNVQCNTVHCIAGGWEWGVTSISGLQPAVACRHHRYWAEMMIAMRMTLSLQGGQEVKGKGGEVRKIQISNGCVCVFFSMMFPVCRR